MKMKIIINTFKYGSSKTKAVLAFALVSGLATVGFVASAVIFSQMVLFFFAIMCFFITISLMQTFAINESGDGGDVDKANPDMSDQMDDASGSKFKFKLKLKKKSKEKTNKKSKKSSTVKSPKQVNSDEQGVGEEVAASEDDNFEVNTLDYEEANQEAVKLRKKIEDNLKLDDTMEDELASLLEDNEDEEAPQEEQKVVRLTEEEINSYDKRKIKKTLHKYKVKRDHRMVMVDHCDSLKIKQTPAYIWVSDNVFNLLLIEQEPRHITLPLFKLREVTYLKKQEANEDTDYAAFKGKSIFAEMFKPYLPDYTHSTVIDDLTAYKNLYGIGPEIYFTNRSAASLFDLLGAEFRVDDKVTMSPKVNIYFKDTYKANILLRDNVIDANGYADRISTILDGMAKSTISYNEFKDTLNLMIKNKLITQEFAMYYMEVRDKNSR